MSGQLDRMVEALRHQIVERAKATHKDDQAMPFVRHLEIAAEELARPAENYTWETSIANGAWHLSLEWTADPGPEPDQQEPALI